MPYSRDPRAYPSQFFSIWDFLQRNPGSPYIEPFAFIRDAGGHPSSKEAVHYRNKYFAWRRALSREGSAGADFLVGYEAQVKYFHQLSPNLQSLCPTIIAAKFMLNGRPDPLAYCYFVLESRDNSELARGIEATLGALQALLPSASTVPTSPATPTSPLLESAARLTDKAPRIGDGARSAFESIYGPIQARGENKNEAPGEDIPPAYPLDPRQSKDESTDK